MWDKLFSPSGPSDGPEMTDWKVGPTAIFSSSTAPLAVFVIRGFCSRGEAFMNTKRISTSATITAAAHRICSESRENILVAERESDHISSLSTEGRMMTIVESNKLFLSSILAILVAATTATSVKATELVINGTVVENGVAITVVGSGDIDPATGVFNIFPGSISQACHSNIGALVKKTRYRDCGPAQYLPGFQPQHNHRFHCIRSIWKRH